MSAQEQIKLYQQINSECSFPEKPIYYKKPDKEAYLCVTKENGILVVDFKNRNNPLLYHQHKKKNRVTYYRTNRTLKEMKIFLEKVGVNVVKASGSGGPCFIAPYVTLFCKKR